MKILLVIEEYIEFLVCFLQVSLDCMKKFGVCLGGIIAGQIGYQEIFRVYVIFYGGCYYFKNQK